MVPNPPETQMFFKSGAAMPQKSNSLSWVPNRRLWLSEPLATVGFKFTKKSNIIKMLKNLKFLITIPLFEKI
jgi:hypothetical protein